MTTSSADLNLRARKAAPPLGWRPLLTEPAAGRAREAIQAIAEALRSPPKPRGPEYCLMEGKAGLAMFFAYLSIATADDDAREQAFGLLGSAVEGVAASRMHPGLMLGFPGVAWAVEHLDGRICEPDEEDLNDGVDRILLEVLSGTPNGGWYLGHDLMFGITGIGVYALERLPRPSGRRILEAVIDRLEALSQARDEGIAWASSSNALPPEHREEFPDGYFSLGVAHGSPGIIGFLSLAYAAGVERSRVRRLLDGAVDWLLAHRLTDAHGTSFATWVSSDPTPARPSWCYGNPAIATCLMTAGRCTGERAWEDLAHELAVVTAGKPFEESGVMDAGLCHGAAGVGHLLNRVFQATGDERLRDAARYWFDVALDMRDPGRGLGGYLTYRQDDGDPEPLRKTDPGVLTGVAGIGLALLAAVTPVEPLWDRVLLAAIPPRSPRG